MDRPTMPLSMESLDITANRAEKNTTRFPRNSRRMANHLLNKRKHTDTNKYISFEKVLDRVLPSSSIVKKFKTWPVRNNPRINTFQIFINSYFIVFEEPFLMVVGSYHRKTRHGLTKVRVYWRARHWIQATQLSGSCNIESLGGERKKKYFIS